MRSEGASASAGLPEARGAGIVTPRARPRAQSVVRAIFLTHRYLGIGIGLLMALWCLSGIVMIYVPYPAFSENERLGTLPPINWNSCCDIRSHESLRGSVHVSSFQLEMLGDTPILRLALADGGMHLMNPVDGRAIRTIGREEAWAAAAQFGTSRGLSMKDAQYALLDHDQWTVGGFRADRPLHWIAFNDADGTEVYVSSRTGKVVQLTTRSQRFWGWVGAVPHWLYPSALRRHPEAWSQVVIWTSALGVFLTVTGLYIGIRQLGRRRNAGPLASPYRGIMFWHHVPGLIFGCFVLTWVLSGLLSMTPWGLFESGSVADARASLQGEPPTLAEAHMLLNSVPRNAPNGVVSVRSAVFDGHLYAVSTGIDGSRRRFTAAGSSAELGAEDYGKAAQLLGAGKAQPATWAMITEGDSYHYSVGREYAQLPAVRIAAGSTLYYLDAVTGELINKADKAARDFRWWHSALHRLDFSAPLRTTLGRSLLMLPLLLGAAFVCAIGAYLGIKRLRR